MVNHPQKWEIFFTDLDPTTGSEQSGKRPALIISNNAINQSLPVAIVLPVTKAKPGRKVYPTEAFLPASISGLPKDSIVMCHQIRTIAKSRLLYKAGAISDRITQEAILKVCHDVIDMS